MERKAFVMEIFPAAHAEYERRHSPIWPELAATLKAHGGQNYSIFLDARRNLLFGYVEIESEARWKAVAETEVCQRWWASMRELMVTHADNSPVSTPLKSVFWLE